MKRWIKDGQFWNGKSIILDVEFPDDKATFQARIEAEREIIENETLTDEEKHEQLVNLEVPVVNKLVPMMIFNPTDEQLIQAGYTEWTPPTPPEPTLEDIKRNKISEIEQYDSSSAVNEFFIGNASLWLDKATRAGLMLRIESEIATGKETTTLWYNEISFTMPIGKAKELLYAIEVYASECYDNTAQHKANVNALDTKEEVETYDYTTGYPEKLSLELNNE